MSGQNPPPATPASTPQATSQPVWQVWASAGGTIGLFLILLTCGVYYILNPNPILVSLLLGAAGGIAHEIAQSGGKVIVPTADATGSMYLGSLSGAVLGVVAGFLVLRGASLSSPAASDMVSLAVEALTAGVALKGIADVDAPAKKT